MPRRTPPSAPVDPYALLADRVKTTLACPGGRVLGYGPGPGLAQCIAWNGIGSLFSAYRPSVARLTVFDLGPNGAAVVSACRSPLPLQPAAAVWHPNHARAEYMAKGLHIAEDRYAVADGLACRLTLRLAHSARRPREFAFCFHGQVEQWPFFDYPAVDIAGARPSGRRATGAERAEARAPRPAAAPLVRCAIDPARAIVTLRQPHPHPGLPLDSAGAPPCTLQTVSASLPFAGYGFGLSEADLRALWRDHGPLASLRLRLGQVGGRYAADSGAAVTAAKERRPEAGTGVEFAHRHPLYYFSVRVLLEPGKEQQVIVESRFRVDPDANPSGGGDSPPSLLNTRRPVAAATQTMNVLKQNHRAWQRYLAREVPQLACSDPALTKYWYYVWHVLRANRCAPGAHIRHAWTAPSKSMYWGPWIWDGYFHVLGEMWLADAAVALDSIRAVLDMQFPNGFLPVCSGADYRMCFHDQVDGYTAPAGYGGYASYVPPELNGYTEGAHPFEARITVGPAAGRSSSDRRAGGPTQLTHNEKTQTPLITLAAADLLRLRGDELPGGRQAAARELLGPLWAYEEWLWRRRTDAQGRFILWHGDESGWDNATRHYPVPALPYDVQVHCLLHRAALREVMLVAGETAQLAELDRRIELTRSALDTYWHADDRWHYDLAGDDVGPGRAPAAGGAKRDAVSSRGAPRQSPVEPMGDMAAGARPGPTGPASTHRTQIAASGLCGLLADTRLHVVDSALFALGHPRVFASAFPIPTLAICDPDYAPHGWGWNGPAWLQVNYFVITGLLQAARGGRRDALEAAWQLWEQTKALVIRDGEPYSYELYDPETGTGMGCPDYSWQAMLLHLIIAEFAGVPVGDPVGPALVRASGPDKSGPYAAALQNGGKVPPPLVVLSPCLPPSLDHLRLTNLPGAVRAIELTRERGGLRIDTALSRAGRIALRDGGLGGCASVSLADGTALQRAPDGAWRLPGGRPRRAWQLLLRLQTLDSADG